MERTWRAAYVDVLFDKFSVAEKAMGVTHELGTEPVCYDAKLMAIINISIERVGVYEYEVDGDIVPLIAVRYIHAKRENAMNCLDAISMAMDRSELGVSSTVISANAVEHMAAWLAANGTQLSDESRAAIRGDAYGPWKASFIVPAYHDGTDGVPDPEALALCKVCGKGESRSRCSRCKAVVYCSRSCQKIDWKAHKQVCVPISTNVFSVQLDKLEQKHIWSTPFNVPIDKIGKSMETPLKNGSVPTNLTGRKLIFKVQLPIDWKESGNVLLNIYDETRSIGTLASVESFVDPAKFDDLVALMETSPWAEDSKAYLYGYATTSKLSLVLDSLAPAQTW
ncbi:uncharacterized protein AMSG_07680 [Thecamonas trahens ATCC 50062]|uniref:MYND-type domain-containing protein n=1 Tax=Thecamonas trahens ATCC 50062 TaxID=461836 RepID=A0A0L0DGM1_THETB|nr:hypothetical protein AMSG_07680 [Thecamonas trahens ATCC 50062]KNC51484.1 hypothetical protein AMSG_07680 [Thecamonas trahens ATCC 50062]|eukprot:XP_013756143.1 hypothetical protein AMSG_07680 [Thecamonas trahens ATCC 50062]